MKRGRCQEPPPPPDSKEPLPAAFRSPQVPWLVSAPLSGWLEVGLPALG